MTNKQENSRSQASKNYNDLVRSFALLNNQYVQLRRAYDILQKKYESEMLSKSREIERLEREKSLLKEDCNSHDIAAKQQMELREKEIIGKMRKEIVRITDEKEQLLRENEELEQSREEIHRKLLEQTAKCRRMKADREMREGELRNEYEEQISGLTKQLNAQIRMLKHKRCAMVCRQHIHETVIYFAKENVTALIEIFETIFPVHQTAQQSDNL
ncbi:unnamed protein product [Gongylonema pulchrum]|uniref:TACC_C domain-containing protein n=1 Tax=Gongylonema pulchrum TaxID=637853 RepID=A0A183D2T4_9BILA|nr:unnamed protein product [Gongylonema pulchrum]